MPESAGPATVELSCETDFEGFRRAARSLLARGAAPEDVTWTVAGRAAPGLFATTPEAAAPAGTEREFDGSPALLRVSPSFVELCGHVALHRDPMRFDLLYRLLWRLQREPGLRDDPLDPGMAQASRMAQAVRRDMHKMKAFVRFREVAQGDGEPPLHVAWFEPGHHTVEATSGFFVRRFAGMRWAILTPDRCAHWDGQALRLGPGASRQEAPGPDAGEALWLTYYRSIFNPARLKLRAMENEMPRRYWHNLPEAALISQLAAASAQRSEAMVGQAPTLPRRRIPVAARAVPAQPGAQTSAAAPPPNALPARATPDERRASLDGLRAAAARCRDCPLGARATHTVWGEGPVGARLMLVGEQPGDREDLEGRPFVGPAGGLLAQALDALGWSREALYLTNAVKHFKHEPRGKRRLHKTPAQQEAAACQHWLDAEIALVRPRAIVALGATAARQLLGRPIAVTDERGRWLPRDDGLPVLVTLHPAALLRAPPDQRPQAYARWLADLRLADGDLAPARA